MKNALYIAFVLLGFFATAQESFPNKHPELLIGKNVKIINTIEMNALGGMTNLFTDPNLKSGTTYKPMAPNDHKTGKHSVLGHEFKVTAVDSILPKYSTEKVCRISLEGADGLTLYYKYNVKQTYDYPFEVIGGFTLPEDFYCDYIKMPVKASEDLDVLIGRATRLQKSFYKGEHEYNLSACLIGPNSVGTTSLTSVTLFFDNGAKLLVEGQDIKPTYNTDTTKRYDFYVFIRDKQIKLFLDNKLIAVKVGNEILKYDFAEKTRGVMRCMEKIK